MVNYTTTRNIRELQHPRGDPRDKVNYTTTRNIRELQPERCSPSPRRYYTTTRNIRELQPRVGSVQLNPIIPQQETSGNYNGGAAEDHGPCIIPQQETSGNYNWEAEHPNPYAIIPQQETSGNYNLSAVQPCSPPIIPQQETSGNYNSVRMGYQSRMPNVDSSLAHVWRTTLQKGIGSFSAIFSTASVFGSAIKAKMTTCNQKRKT